jgi:hypothetical protein
MASCMRGHTIRYFPFARAAQAARAHDKKALELFGVPAGGGGKDLISQPPMQLLIQLPIEIIAEGPPDGESYLEMFAAPRQRTAPSTQRLRCVWTYQDRSLEKD